MLGHIAVLRTASPAAVDPVRFLAPVLFSGRLHPSIHPSRRRRCCFWRPHYGIHTSRPVSEEVRGSRREPESHRGYHTPGDNPLISIERSKHENMCKNPEAPQNWMPHQNGRAPQKLDITSNEIYPFKLDDPSTLEHNNPSTLDNT